MFICNNNKLDELAVQEILIIRKYKTRLFPFFLKKKRYEILRTYYNRFTEHTMASFGAIQTEASRVFVCFREDNIDVPEGHPCWMELSEILRKVEVSAERIPMLRMLANMGVQHSEEQTKVKEACEAQATVSKYLQSIETTLAASSGEYLDGDTITLSDVSMACAIRPLVSYVYTLWDFPNVSKWFKLCTSLPQFQKVTASAHAVGLRRIGNQVDRRPNPLHARLGAVSAQERNKGSKKDMSQRQKEKAAKKKAKEAESSAPSTDKQADVAPFSLGDRVEIDAGKDARTAAIHASLDRLGITYEFFPHEATPTVEEMMKATGHLSGGHCKNLFLKAKKPSRTRKPDTKIWLVVALHDTKVDLKSLSKALGYKDQMRMGKPDLLGEKLGVIQGEVSPLALLNNAAADVQVLLDSKMMTQERLWFHPLTMEGSTAVTPADLQKFIGASGRQAVVYDF